MKSVTMDYFNQTWNKRTTKFSQDTHTYTYVFMIYVQYIQCPETYVEHSSQQYISIPRTQAVASTRLQRTALVISRKNPLHIAPDVGILPNIESDQGISE